MHDFAVRFLGSGNPLGVFLDVLFLAGFYFSFPHVQERVSNSQVLLWMLPREEKGVRLPGLPCSSQSAHFGPTRKADGYQSEEQGADGLEVTSLSIRTPYVRAVFAREARRASLSFAFRPGLVAAFADFLVSLPLLPTPITTRKATFPPTPR